MNDIEGQQTVPSAPFQSPPQYQQPTYAQPQYPDPVINTAIQPYPPQREQIVYIQPIQPIQPIQYELPRDEMGIAPALYCASCAIFFIPFGWLIGIFAACWFQRLSRPRTIPEVRAYKFLNICLIVNLIFTILFLIFV